LKEILIIEDSAQLRAGYRRFLGNKDEFQFAEADTADKAIAFLSSESFYHVVCDYNLERGTGRDVYNWLVENRPEQLERFTFVCGSYADVSDLDAHHIQKGSMGLNTELLERLRNHE
jgi:DNA-binding NarL/FixJ family response regulator